MERNQSPLFNAKLVDHENGVRVYEPPGSASDTPAYQVVAGGGWSASATPPFQGVAGGSGGLSSGNSSGESFKRKRGRPRKYGPDGTPILAVSPLSRSPAPPTFSPATNMAATVAAEGAKKSRGRPRGSTNKRHIKSLGSTGTGFMPHVIAVQTGEDVSAKIMEFSQQSRRAICVLSANGAIANASLRQISTSGGTVTYEGRFEVLSLSGSLLLSHSGGQQSRTGGLSVSLAGPDGHVIGGGVAGVLIAASPMQVIVGSFTSEGKKETGHSGAKDFEMLASLAESFSP
ncbi:AT-hook motif nuclear-localized protein 10-like isoform X1 [Zingiber officinale]|uniref:AT-hook motif nuclear-localized protein 10-like isoform X1 n=1 Tax=Zingiber officinale TaxID=94328 RepID=UPI001C4D3CEE|nr:AT-hook motif nuclear-localized protein 10-like isoform X1 [Zingiber officinale]XP_042402509.1 AT-hook motif nuclear-localized protein 10-like isoform X1 [Zingiber officinale]XP_042402510.1 AT-hook motif nuclear-localized protein 10-like isoform X1 [Zingiber officinale]XP_042402511.1 AT-hook motif nuclear-localized protein 10-like isoform X1 [Zingiber officinale]